MWSWVKERTGLSVAERVLGRRRLCMFTLGAQALWTTTAIVLPPPLFALPPSPRSSPPPDADLIDRQAMSAIGSVFLGDVQRHRNLSSSTPPSSPPPHLSTNTTHSFSDLDDMEDQKPPALAVPAISPILSLELRLRWLETLLFGAKHEAQEQAAKSGSKTDKLKDGDTLARRAEDLQRRLEQVAQSSDALKRFMDRCECLKISYFHDATRMHVLCFEFWLQSGLRLHNGLRMCLDSGLRGLRYDYCILYSELLVDGSHSGHTSFLPSGCNLAKCRICYRRTVNPPRVCCGN